MNSNDNARFEVCFSDIDKFFLRRHLLSGVSLKLQSGRAVLLSGENGAGKTTLLKILAGLEKPQRCMVDFAPVDADAGADAKSLAWSHCRRRLQREVMYLHQSPYLFDGGVSRNLALALPRALPRAMRDKKIRQALQWAQLESLHDARAKTLSGGEKQRVALARAWLRQARVLLLDEPIANMDSESQSRTVALLQRLKDTGAALLIASHNTDAFCRLVERRLVLACGKLHAVDGDGDGKSNITAVVLAGGRATRMGGVDKGLVVLRGRPLAAGIGAALAMQSAVAEVVINANRNIAKYRGLGYRVVEDRLPDHQGPLAGMHAALLAAAQPWLLTIPCDGPFVAGDYAQRMHAAAIDAGAKLAVAHDGARMQPVYSLIHRDLSDDLEQFLQSGQRKIDKWHARHAFATVDFSAAPEMFTNINTEEQLNALENG